MLYDANNCWFNFDECEHEQTSGLDEGLRKNDYHLQDKMDVVE